MCASIVPVMGRGGEGGRKGGGQKGGREGGREGGKEGEREEVERGRGGIKGGAKPNISWTVFTLCMCTCKSDLSGLYNRQLDYGTRTHMNWI